MLSEPAVEVTSQPHPEPPVDPGDAEPPRTPAWQGLLRWESGTGLSCSSPPDLRRWRPALHDDDQHLLHRSQHGRDRDHGAAADADRHDGRDRPVGRLDARDCRARCWATCSSTGTGRSRSAMVIVLVVGAAGGALNGFLVTRLELPSIAVTIGTLALYRGIAEIILGDRVGHRIPDVADQDRRRPDPGTPSWRTRSGSSSCWRSIFGVVLHATPVGRVDLSRSVSNPRRPASPASASKRIKFTLFVPQRPGVRVRRDSLDAALRDLAATTPGLASSSTSWPSCSSAASPSSADAARSSASCSLSSSFGCLQEALTLNNINGRGAEHRDRGAAAHQRHRPQRGGLTAGCDADARAAPRPGTRALPGASSDGGTHIQQPTSPRRPPHGHYAMTSQGYEPMQDRMKLAGSPGCRSSPPRRLAALRLLGRARPRAATTAAASPPASGPPRRRRRAIKKGLKVYFIPKDTQNPYEVIADQRWYGGAHGARRQGGRRRSGTADTAAAQIPSIQAAIQAHADAIVIAGNDPSALCPSLAQAQSAGIKVVSFDSDVTCPTTCSSTRPTPSRSARPRSTCWPRRSQHR